MSLKDDWKAAGKGLGRSFAGLGKSIIKSVQVKTDRAAGAPQEETPDLRESWREVGRSFGETGLDLGRALAGTAEKAASAIENKTRDSGDPE